MIPVVTMVELNLEVMRNITISTFIMVEMKAKKSDLNYLFGKPFHADVIIFMRKTKILLEYNQHAKKIKN